MNNHYPRIFIAGVRGGSGKTTVALSVISALRSSPGLNVVPFKKGPDYIDPGWLSLASGNPCYTLDTFLIPKDRIISSFLLHFSGDVAVVEGNRGLHDGTDTEGTYSSAELAKLLKCPVVLVVDCTKMTRTAAAVVLGCRELDPEVRIEGIILNQVAGQRHEVVIRSAIEKYCSLPVVGAIPRFSGGEIPERHMGLTPRQEHPDYEESLARIRSLGERYLNIGALLEIAFGAGPMPEPELLSDSGDRKQNISISSEEGAMPVRIGVVRDSAFQFYYPENLEVLQEAGAKLIFIDATRQKHLPLVDALYIGGGFPETHAFHLSENESFRKDIRDAAFGGLPIYAECGGLMFLGMSIRFAGSEYPMAGVFPIRFEMEEKPRAHGYTVVKVVRDNPFFSVGTELRGHEFHYSRPFPEGDKYLSSCSFEMIRGEGIDGRMDGVVFRNVLATYTHIHAYSADAWCDGMIKKAKEFQKTI